MKTISKMKFIFFWIKPTSEMKEALNENDHDNEKALIKKT